MGGVGGGGGAVSGIMEAAVQTSSLRVLNVVFSPLSYVICQLCTCITTEQKAGVTQTQWSAGKQMDTGLSPFWFSFFLQKLRSAGTVLIVTLLSQFMNR